MSLKKIKDNYFEKLKMNKYELFVKVIDYIGNFPNILDGFYINGSGQGYGDYDSVLINSGFNEIGNFPYIMSGIYLNNEKIRSGEYQGLGINIGWKEEDETALYIFESEKEIEDIERVY